MLKILVMISCFAGILSCNRTKVKPLNVVLILTDDHAVQAISAYSRQLIHTPNIDRLVTDGICFDKAYVTNSICSPSRACILTGKYSHINGQKTNHDTFDGSQNTFPKTLQNHGYQTAYIGKWHLKSVPTGFDHWNILPDQGSYYQPDFIKMGDTIRSNGYVTDITTDFAIDWVEKREKDKPFFLFFSQKAPHRNWMPAIRHLDTFSNTTFPLPPAFRDTYDGKLAALTQEMNLNKDFLPWYDAKASNVNTTSRDSLLWKTVFTDRLTPREQTIWKEKYNKINEKYKRDLESGMDIQTINYQAYMRDYLRCVIALDENIGRFLDYLKANDLDENTIIIYVSDQGMYLGEHGWFDKRWMYEESYRMPLIIKSPNLKNAHLRNKDFILNIDLAPTILDIANIPIPIDMQGSSFKSLLDKISLTEKRDAIYYHYYEYPKLTHVNPHYGIRTDDYKLIRFYGDVDGWELYDMKNDIHEMHNIYNDPNCKEIVSKLKQKLEVERKKWKDTE